MGPVVGSHGQANRNLNQAVGRVVGAEAQGVPIHAGAQGAFRAAGKMLKKFILDFYAPHPAARHSEPALLCVPASPSSVSSHSRGTQTRRMRPNDALGPQD